MPTWVSKGHPRGLLAWGETRKKNKKVKRLGKFAHICRTVVIRSLEFYFATVGLPPVNAGESLRRAINEGRYAQESYKPSKGATRGQQRLIELLPPAGPQRFWEVFVLVVAAAYCEFMDPPLDDGTEGSYAVLGVFQEKEVKAKLLAQVRNTFPHTDHKPTHTLIPYSVQGASTASTFRSSRS